MKECEKKNFHNPYIYVISYVKYILKGKHCSSDWTTVQADIPKDANKSIEEW